MFPRYLFFRPSNPKQSIAAARSSRGVSHVVSFGSKLAQASTSLLQIIREVENQRNSLERDALSPFQPGALVRLRDNPLAGMEGVIHAVGSKRVLLLMEVLGRSKLVKVKPGQIEFV
jgi:transcriptional antiterminator RfaH